MNPRTLAAGIAFALLATLLAPVHTAQPQPPQAGIVITAASPFMVAEESAARTYTVKLATPPVTDVAVTISGFDAGLSVSPARLYFGAMNGTTAQTVTVSVAGSDAVVEGTHVYTLLHTASGQDPSYGSAAGPAKTASLTVYAADNDTGAVVAQSGGSTQVTEDVANDTLVVSLGSQPSGTVSVRLTPSDGDQLILDRFTVFFNAGNWFIPVSVKVSAVHDDVAEGTLSRSVAVTTTGSGVYGSIPAQTIPVTLLDNDLVALRFRDTSTPGSALTGSPPVINPSGLTSAAANSEAGSAGYTVALGSKPAGTVTVALSDPTGQATPSPSTLTFGPGNWSFFQTVTVTAVQDFIDEGANNVALQVSIVHDVSSSADAAYNALANAPAVFRYLDDDTAGYVFNDSSTLNQTPSNLKITEGGDGADVPSYKVKLNSEPTAPATMALTTDGQYTVSPSSIVFTSTNWNQDVTVTLAAVNDDIDEDDSTPTLGQAMTSADGRYSSITQTFTVQLKDNDLARIDTTAPAATGITENGPAQTFGVRLHSQPTAPITVSLTVTDQISASPGSLTFTAANWNTLQTVTVTAVDDAQSETQKQASVTLDPGGDAKYNAAAVATVAFNVLDDDGVVIVGESDGVTMATEGAAAGSPGADTFTVRLVNRPTAMVNVTVTAPAGLKVDGGSTVTLHFDNRIPEQTTTLVDTVDGVLELLGLDALDLGAVHAKAGSPWNMTQTVTVTSDNDNAVTGSQLLTITQTVQSADNNYDAGHGALARPVAVYRLDNDPGILVEETAGGTAVTEGGQPDTYTVRLATAPAEGVAIVLEHDGQVSLSDPTLYFDAYGWDIAQTVSVTAVQDHVDEANTVLSTIHHRVSTNDATYRTQTANDVAVTVTDSDSAGITLTQSGGNTAVTEGGAADSYTLVLTSVPPGPVSIALSAPGTQLTFPSTVSFTPANWNVPQTVSVQAVDDSLAEGPMTVAIHHDVTGFPGVTLADVAVAVTDNDAAGVLVTESGGSTVVNEGGNGDGITFRLTSQPTADVTVTLASSSQVVLLKPVMVFSAGNWSANQLSWINALNDNAVEGTHSATVTITVTSADPAYNGMAVASRTVTINDND